MLFNTELFFNVSNLRCVIKVAGIVAEIPKSGSLSSVTPSLDWQATGKLIKSIQHTESSFIVVKYFTSQIYLFFSPALVILYNFRKSQRMQNFVSNKRLYIDPEIIFIVSNSKLSL